MSVDLEEKEEKVSKKGSKDPNVKVYENCVCPFCATLCDDIVLEVKENRIIKTNGCSLSKGVFYHAHEDVAVPMVEGKQVPYEETLKKAAEILAKAKFPLIYGLSATSVEAQRKSIELGDLIGANFDNCSSVCHSPTMVALQLGGAPAATLGEVKNRADVVVFWGSNAAEAHPRHYTRYSVNPKGMFVPEGRKGRKVIVVDIRPTSTSKGSDMFIQVQPGKDFEIFQTCRAILRDLPIEVEEVGGVPVSTLREFIDILKSAKLGVMFFGQGLTETRGKHMNSAAIYALGKEMNRFTKFLALPMRGHYNVVGSGNTLAWQTGYPFAVNFSRGFPQFNPGEYSVVDLLARKEIDVCVVIAAEPMDHLPHGAAEHLKNIPTIVLDPRQTLTTDVATVVIPVAHSGISRGGTAYRMDHVPIPMTKVLETPYPNDEEAIEKIIQYIREIRKAAKAA